MKTTGYREDLRGWQMDNGQILSMPPEAKEDEVIAEGERLAALQAVVIEPVAEPSPGEKLDAAIEEYIAATGMAVEDVATVVLERMPLERKAVYLSERVDAVAAEIDAKAELIDTGGDVEKPIDIVKVG